MRIREATDDDWDGIWPFLADIVRAGDTYCWPVDTTEDEARAWWTGRPGGLVHVAVDDDGAVVGTAEVHPNQPAAGSHIANAGFMVAPEASGRGVGRALAVHVLDAARAEGFAAMQFNAVVETNVYAIRLWRSLGFRVLATVPAAFEHPTEGRVGLHIMHRDLTAP